MLNHGKQLDAGHWHSKPRGISQVHDEANRVAVPAAWLCADDLIMFMSTTRASLVTRYMPTILSHGRS